MEALLEQVPASLQRSSAAWEEQVEGSDAQSFVGTLLGLADVLVAEEVVVVQAVRRTEIFGAAACAAR